LLNVLKKSTLHQVIQFHQISVIWKKIDVSAIEIPLQDVYINLLKLDCNKSSGPDQISPEFLYKCADHLASPLHIILNKSLSSGEFPDDRKKSFLTPIYKSGDRTNIEKYRGIAILSAIPKLFEKLVCDELYKISDINYHKQQHGFTKNRSIISNLMIYTKFIFDAFENNNQVVAIYTNFSKAFDSVDHKIFLNKLNISGLQEIF
jgi:Reverse transcriptase (RNA-dependent DNA polymerase)